VALIAGQLLDVIKHRLGGQADALIGGGIGVINQAGRWVFGVHSWRRASRLSATLAFVDAQPWVALPSGFLALLDVETTTVLGNPVSQVGYSELLTVRTQNPDLSGFPWYVAVEHYLKSTGGVGDRLAIHPEPGDDEADALKITYRTGWVNVTAPKDTVEVHEMLEPFLIHAVREYAAGMEFGDLDARLSAVTQGALFQAAKLADGDAQPFLGPMRGGAVDMQCGRRDPYDWMNGSVTTTIT
jgi:hypothetical protein